MTTHDMPAPIRRFVDAVNAHDEAAFLDAFADPGTVDDWGRQLVGRDAIKAWSDREFLGAHGTMDVTDVSDDGDEVVVTADWRSNHANGLSRFAFTLDDDGQVVTMTITGAEG